MATGESVQDGPGAETADPGCDLADPLDDLERAPSTLSGRRGEQADVPAWVPDAAELLERAAVLIEAAGEDDLATVVRAWQRLDGVDHSVLLRCFGRLQRLMERGEDRDGGES